VARGESDIMILSDLNTDRYALTDQLRSHLKEHGVIDSNEVPINILQNRDLTQAQLQHSRYYNVGDFAVFHKSVENFKPNEIYRISDVDNIKNVVALTNNTETIWAKADSIASATLFNESTIQVAKGDTLRWTRNHEGRVNKNQVQVISVDRHSITIEDQQTGKTEKISTKLHTHLDYGLVMTVYSSQGHDKKHGIFLAESNISMNTWYTALTRMKESIIVITDNEEKLLDRVQKSTTKVNALDLMENKAGWIELNNDQKKPEIAQELNRGGPELGI